MKKKDNRIFNTKTFNKTMREYNALPWYSKALDKIIFKITSIPSQIRGIFYDIVFFLRHGFRRRDAWDLGVACSRFMHKRLVVFNKERHGYPGHLSDKEWNKRIRKMIRAFQLIKDGKEEISFTSVEQINKYVGKHNTIFKQDVVEGLELFHKHFQDLWD